MTGGDEFTVELGTAMVRQYKQITGAHSLIIYIHIQIYVVVISVCFPVCLFVYPIITHNWTDLHQIFIWKEMFLAWL